MPLLKTLILGFIAGFLAVLIFHQSLWYVLNLVGLIPPDRPAWPLDPIPPYRVPSVISKAFWGGVWGAVLAPVLQNLRGLPYWGAGSSWVRWCSRSSPFLWCRRSRASRSRNCGRAFLPLSW